MINWYKFGRTVADEGSTDSTITYKAEGSGLYIESRRRHIPHAARAGCWDVTVYKVMAHGHEVKEFRKLMDAKAFIENGGK